MISILECRKALHESQNAESQEKLRIEYFALKEQRKHLRKRYRVLKVQCHKPIKAHITQLQKIKNHIVQASGQTYLSLRIEFYLVLTEAKNMLQANMLGSTDDLY